MQPTKGKLNYAYKVRVKNPDFVYDKLLDWVEEKSARGYRLRTSLDRDWIHIEHDSREAIRIAYNFLARYKKDDRRLW